MRIAALLATLLLAAGPAFGGEKGKASTYTDTEVFCPGERFEAGALAAAHRTLPCGTLVLVKNLRTRKRAVVRITDRGPCNTVRCRRERLDLADRVIDLTPAAATEIGSNGLDPVELFVLTGFEVRWEIATGLIAGLRPYGDGPRVVETSR